MAPTRVKKSRTSADNNPPAHPFALQSPARTPKHSPQKRTVSITEGQKQALIDNLQLEITERARKLRAQYALQAQSLRTRIELRINRIPTSLRKANMGDLFEKYMDLSERKQKNVPVQTKAVELGREPTRAQKIIVVSEDAESSSAPRLRGTKRTSDAMENVDKENNAEPAQPIPNPKKRTKANKAESRQVTNPSTILSPKSANSRTLPHSPIRPALCSPQKSYLSRPVSPLKPCSPVKIASPAKAAAAAATANLASMIVEKPKAGRPKAATTRNASNPKSTNKNPGSRTRRGAENVQEPEDVRKVSNTSNISSASTGTTIVKNTRKAPLGAAKKNVGASAVGKKVAAAVEAPAPGRRVLRKR